jgi:hypothetical protein
MTDQKSYIQKRKRFEELFFNYFEQGEGKVFVILDYLEENEKPYITFIHRMRFGSEVLPIPAWLNRDKAEKFIQRTIEGVFTTSRVVEISRIELQEMIRGNQIAKGYPSVATYHLDLQVSQEEIDRFLEAFGEEPKTAYNQKAP